MCAYRETLSNRCSAIDIIYRERGIPPIDPRPFAVSPVGANTFPRTTLPPIPYPHLTYSSFRLRPYFDQPCNLFSERLPPRIVIFPLTIRSLYGIIKRRSEL